MTAVRTALSRFHIASVHGRSRNHDWIPKQATTSWSHAATDPAGFDELVGQDHVGRALQNAIETNRVGTRLSVHRSSGCRKDQHGSDLSPKPSTSRRVHLHPDNESDVAQAIDSGEDVDVIEIDGASNRGIDEIRSLACQRRCAAEPLTLQDLHHRRSPHVDRRGLQCVAQNARRAARTREVHLLHHGSRKDSDHGAESLSTFRLCTGRISQDRGTTARNRSRPNTAPPKTKRWN